MTPTAITSVHGHVPDYVLTNSELEGMVGTDDAWIRERTGIGERRILKGKGQGTSHMAAKAVEGLLQKRGLHPGEIDCLICATVTPDFPFPATANLICRQTGIKSACSFDVGAACSGFLYALSLGDNFVKTGMYRKVVVVGADKMSSIVDYSDRETCIIFGDGAGAALLEPSGNGCGILDAVLQSDGCGAGHLYQKAGGSRHPASIKTCDERQHFVHQQGKAVYKHAINKMVDVSRLLLQRNNLAAGDIDWLVPHQANGRIIAAVGRQLGIPAGKTMSNIGEYGNTSAAGIPLCLWNWESRLKKGDRLLLTAFGGGFTWASICLSWAY